MLVAELANAVTPLTTFASEIKVLDFDAGPEVSAMDDAKESIPRVQALFAALREELGKAPETTEERFPFEGTPDAFDRAKEAGRDVRDQFPKLVIDTRAIPCDDGSAVLVVCGATPEVAAYVRGWIEAWQRFA